jgi:nicotinamidase-related amidase
MTGNGLIHGSIGSAAVHVCIDMQRLFAKGSPWAIPWLHKVLPNVAAIVDAHPQETVFTRFVPAETAEKAGGGWAKYYQRWPEITLENLDPSMVELMSELARHVPPARQIDKKVYSPWTEGILQKVLRDKEASTLIISGGETDICVLGTVLGAVDYGYRVILASDALCSSSDETHDALMRLYRDRFSVQIEAASTKDILSNWA